MLIIVALDDISAEWHYLVFIIVRHEIFFRHLMRDNDAFDAASRNGHF